MSQNESTLSTRILVVDDDPGVLSGYERTLRKFFDVKSVGSGQAALDALKNGDHYSVIAVDARMPGMSGNEVLIAAQKLSPKTIRIMVTGAGDQQTAVEAVNTGRVFRFLNKPCGDGEFLTAIREGVALHDRNRHEEELLEQTFNGALEMLTDVLSVVAPEAFERGQKMRKLARQVGEKLGLDSTWELESAAMLLRIGMVTVPPRLAAKMQSIEPLSTREQEIAANIPEIGAKLLEKIPRLSPVAEIVRFQMKGFDGSGPPDSSHARAEIPIGSRVLRVLVDAQSEVRSGMEMDEAIAELKRNIHLYDSQVVAALEAIVGIDGSSGATETRSKYFMASELKPGMILETDARSDEDFPILAADTELTEMFIARLQNFSELKQLHEPLIIVPSSIPAD